MTNPNQPPAGKRDNSAQSDAFLEKARELEAEGDNAKADTLMGRLARMKPEPRAKKTPATLKKAPGLPKTGDRSNH